KPTDLQKAQLDELHFHEFDGSVFPDKKVKVGDTWSVEAKTFATVVGAPVTDPKGKIKGTFKKIVTLGGERCALVEFDVDFSGKTKAKEGKGTVAIKGKWMAHRSLKEGLNLKNRLDATFTVEFSGKDGDKDVDVVSKGKMTGEETTTRKK